MDVGCMHLGQEAVSMLGLANQDVCVNNMGPGEWPCKKMPAQNASNLQQNLLGSN